MDPIEIACGWVSGYDIDSLPRAAAAPRVALDEVLARYLEFSPCFIAFSGGRDSSALLAAAVALARREGLPLPVPITLAYPGVADTDEASWQRRVLEYVGVSDRIVLEVDDEHDAVGPIATMLLRRYGQLWPANIAPTWRMMDQARGGALLTGEGGDEIFGLKRITPLTKMLKTRGRVSRRVYPLAAEAVAPAWVRRRAALRTRYRPPWLREPAQALLSQRYAEDHAVFALHAGRHAWQFAARRGTRRGLENLTALASELDVAYGHPFQEPAFLAAFAAAAGFWGWTGRTATMRYLFDDVLPPDVLERQTKAVFNNAVFTEHTRAFVRGWDGEGVDAELVDPAILRAHWLSATPHGPSMALLQQAWLHTSADLSGLSRT